MARNVDAINPAARNDSKDFDSLYPQTPMYTLPVTHNTSGSKTDPSLEQIEIKVKSGQVLTSDEMAYLKIKNVALYEQSVRTRELRDNLIQKIGRAHSNEDIQGLYTQQIQSITNQYGVYTNPKITQSEMEKYHNMVGIIQSTFINYAPGVEFNKSYNNLYGQNVIDTVSTSKEANVMGVALFPKVNDADVKTNTSSKTKLKAPNSHDRNRKNKRTQIDIKI